MSTSVQISMQKNRRLARVRFFSENGIQLLTAAARDQLADVLGELEAEADCSVVLFEAEGRTFIAGADINELAGLTVETAEPWAREAQQLFERIASLPAVTVSAIHGACAGGGFELSLACDLRMAASGAKIGLPEITLGLLPGWGGTVRTSRLLGEAVARRVILTGELLPADEALRIGLVDQVSPDDDFRAAVEARVEQLLKGGPQARVRVKRLLAHFRAAPIDEQLRKEARAFAECYSTSEPAEGSRAFLEKRRPSWYEAAEPS